MCDIEQESVDYDIHNEFQENDFEDTTDGSHNEHAYAVNQQASTPKSRRKDQRYFANLSLSSNGSKFKTVKTQIDTGGTIAYKDMDSLYQMNATRLHVHQNQSLVQESFLPQVPR
jgi:hypothetical protein